MRTRGRLPGRRRSGARIAAAAICVLLGAAASPQPGIGTAASPARCVNTALGFQVDLPESWWTAALGQNSRFVLALPPRWDFDQLTGVEEVAQLVRGLVAFEPAE